MPLQEPSGFSCRRMRHLVRCTAQCVTDSRRVVRAVSDSPVATTAVSSSTRNSIRPLTKTQLKQFIRDGFIVLQVDGVPDGFHDQVYSKALRMSEDAKHAESGAKIKFGPGGRIIAEGKQSDWSPLTEDFETLLDTPCVRGAATTLAGPGCLMPSVGSPSPLTANPFDQQFHKDGTGTAVREPYPRSIGVWYYPHETTVIMGPTAVVPGSHVFGIDREGFPHSEERIDLRMTPPKSREGWQKELLGWNGHALSIFGHLGVDPATGDLPVPERERRIAEFKTLFGDPTFKEHKLTVPAGSVVIKHNDIVHRRCRSGEDGVTDDGVEWRPMFGLSWTRTMEPTPESLILAPDSEDDDTVDPFALTPEEASHPESAAKVAVWESILSWMQGHGPVASTGVNTTQAITIADVKTLGDTIQMSNSETERVGIAYRLGSIIRQPGAIGETALECLVGCMSNESECVRRAATWGIGLGGDIVVPALLGLMTDELPALPPIVQQNIRTNAGYALRVAVETVTPIAVDALDTAISTCERQLTKRLAELSPEKREALELAHSRGPRGWDGNLYSCVIEMDHEVHELRKTIATSLLALGQLGRLCMANHDCNPRLAQRIWSILHRMSYEYVDAACIFPSHLPANLIQSHADRALCTMLSPDPSSTECDMALRCDQQRETGRGLGLAALALERLRNSHLETATAKLVLESAVSA